MGIENSGTITLGGELTVHRLGYGAMRLCGPGVWGAPTDPANAGVVLRRVRELGVDFIDTSDAYGPHVNEEQLRAALHPYDGVVIATKGGLTRPGPNQWNTSGHPDRLARCIDDSLRRLGVERIDLYQLHAVDDDVPLADSVGALARARDAGKIRLVGLSNVSVAELDEANAIVPVASVQNRYNLAVRVHQPVLDRCEELGVAFLPWYPLNAAGLSGHDTGVLADIARAHGATPSQVALAWLLRKSPVMLPIPGTSKVKHLEENAAGADLVLSDAEQQALDAFAGSA